MVISFQDIKWGKPLLSHCASCNFENKHKTFTKYLNQSHTKSGEIFIENLNKIFTINLYWF